MLVIGNHDETEFWALAAVDFEERRLALSHKPLRRIEATKRHINLTVEQTGYVPLRLRRVS